MAMTVFVTAMPAVMTPMPARTRAMMPVTVPGLGAVSLMPTVPVAVMMMGERPNLVMIVMMRRCHADGNVDAGRSQRRHGEGGRSERQCGKQMLGEFQVDPFDGVDYIHLTDLDGRG